MTFKYSSAPSFMSTFTPTFTLTMCRTVILSLLMLLPLASQASGSFSRGSLNATSARPIDDNYEYGKSLYFGRVDGVVKQQYCVVVDDAKVPVKRKSLKSYKKGSVSHLVNNLYLCNQPDKLAGAEMEMHNFRFVIYYLNKRFRLSLT